MPNPYVAQGADVTQLTREFCSLCKTFGIGFHSPIWKEVAGRHQHDILCLSCFAMLGDEKGIAWEKGIEIYPVSLRTHLYEPLP